MKSNLGLQKEDKYEVKHVESINSENSEFSPIIFNDGVVFSSDRRFEKILNPTYDWTGKPYLSFFYAKADSTCSGLFDPSYFEAEGFSNKLNDAYHDGTAVLNSDRNYHLFYKNRKGER